MVFSSLSKRPTVAVALVDVTYLSTPTYNFGFDQINGASGHKLLGAWGEYLMERSSRRLNKSSFKRTVGYIMQVKLDVVCYSTLGSTSQRRFT